MTKKIKYEGILELAGMQIPCYVLEDGTRVLSGRQMQEALKLVDELPPESGQKPGTRLARYLEQKTLNPYIYKGKEPDHFEPIDCRKGKSKINGFEHKEAFINFITYIAVNQVWIGVQQVSEDVQDLLPKILRNLGVKNTK